LRTLVLAAIAFLAPIGGPAQAVAPSTWSGQDRAFRVDWTAHDITATRLADGKRVFSMQAFAATQLDLSLRQETSAAGTLEREKKVSVVSLFGSLLALRDDTFDDFRPAAHPSERVRFWTIDLAARPKDGFDPSDQYGAAIGAEERGRKRSLDQVVPAAAIAAALGRDKVVLADVPHPPHDLDELMTTWRDQAGNAGAAAPAGEGAGREAPCYDVPEDALSSFAIIGRKGADITVRVGLPGSGACHAAFTQLGLSLPLSDSLAKALATASVVAPPAGLPPLRIMETRQLR
jgi:hypothetical protein